MKKAYSFWALACCLLISYACTEKKQDTSNSNPVDLKTTLYTPNDLGLSYTPSKSVFKIWTPTAQEVTLKLYKEGDGGQPFREEKMQAQAQGVWAIEIAEDLKGTFYTFQVRTAEKLLEETCGIYAKAVGVNGKRAAVIDLKDTNPEGWEQDTKPELKSFSDVILYELHIRDYTLHQSSGVQNKGKYLGLTQPDTKSPDGLPTALSHIKELGVTHVHLLPIADFSSIDESQPNKPQYNWGYDPQNYNIPEGSYSSDATKPEARIRELKELVKAMHKAGLRVVMDVVYNHTSGNANFDREVPNYYYRFNPDGSKSDASACGNETASEMPMMRKYIVESLKYWATEYHIDGFRFDLMAIHDIETMNLIRKELDQIDPTIFLYGEGWAAGGSPLAEEKRALKKFTYRLDRIAVFSDEIRDAIKGHWSDEKKRGFVSQAENLDESLKFGIVGGVPHKQINYKAVNYTDTAWANAPFQTIVYASCHDNHTLFDKLKISTQATPTDLLKMHQLAQTIVLTSQGTPFLFSGEEFMRSKGGNHNSYNASDEVNNVVWTEKKKYEKLFNYYKDLIALRKAHPAFRMQNVQQVNEHLKFLSFKNTNTVGYTIEGNANGDSWKRILVLFNGNNSTANLNLPAGKWKVVADQQGVYPQGGTTLRATNHSLPPISALILAEE